MACFVSQAPLCYELCNSSSLHVVVMIKIEFSSFYALNHKEFMYFLKKVCDNKSMKISLILIHSYDWGIETCRRCLLSSTSDKGLFGINRLWETQLVRPPVAQKAVHPCEYDKTSKHPELETTGKQKSMADFVQSTSMQISCGHVDWADGSWGWYSLPKPKRSELKIFKNVEELQN